MSEPDRRTAGSAADPLIGRVFSDRYRIVSKLEGVGAGDVYLAHHLMLNRRVTIKLLRPELPEQADSFLEEARTVARIGHDNVVEIFTGGRAPGGAVFVATEVLEGVDLEDVLAKNGPMK